VHHDRKRQRLINPAGGEKVTFTAAETRGLGDLEFIQPPRTFALTPASVTALRAVFDHQDSLSGSGLDWGSGVGCLAIAAARIPRVTSVVGLEITAENVLAARDNAARNDVEAKVEFLRADSYAAATAARGEVMAGLQGTTRFVLANPPASSGDDGFGWRREVLRGARDFLVDGGVVFLSVSLQYGNRRIEGLEKDAHGFRHEGVLASTDWAPFDLTRPDLLTCLRLYAAEETRGGCPYEFHRGEAPGSSEPLSASGALLRFEETGQSPLTKWQVRCFRLRTAEIHRR